MSTNRIRRAALAGILLAAFGAWADTWTDPDSGITWTYTVSNGEASLGGGSSSSPAVPKSTSGSITIPQTLGGYPVTKIAQYAFYACSGLTNVTIRAGVTSIGTFAFGYCSGLTNVMISDGVTSIESYTFYACGGLTNVTIPDSVTSIGSYAFCSCRSLTNVSIGSGVKSIGGYAFEDCGVMAYVVAENNAAYSSVNGLLLSKDGKSLVEGVNGDVVIPDGVAKIGNNAFYGRHGLTRLTIPSSVTNIGYSAFISCRGLTAVHIADLSAWCGISFGNSSANPLSSAHKLYINNSLVADMVVPNSVTNIESYAFYGCSSLASVTIPSTVKKIGQLAFSGCSGLSLFSVDSDNPVYSSVDGLLLTKDCKTLVCGVNGDVTIPNCVTSIGNYAFYNCRGLTSVTMSNGVTTIGYCAFCGCSGLTAATIPDSVTRISSEAFNGCGNSLFDTTTIQGVRLVDGWAVMADGSFLSDLDLTAVRGIGDGAFSGCDGIGTVTIPQFACSRQLSDFFLVESVRNVVVADGVTSVGESVFANCGDLVGVVIPNSVTNIGQYAFYNCYSLKSLTIPSSVINIDPSAFYGCGSLVSVSVPQIVCSRRLTDFFSWEFLAQIRTIDIADGVTSISPDAFSGCYGVTSLTIPNSVTNIGQNAFYDCCGLTSVAIPQCMCSMHMSDFFSWESLAQIRTIDVADGVTSIGNDVFPGCYGVTSLTVPNSVTNIEDGAFASLGNLTDVTVPQYVCSKRISDVFPGSWQSITNVVVSDEVTSIGDDAFLGCAVLNRISLPDGLTSIGARAFSGCCGLTSVAFPNGVTNIGEEAFAGCCGLDSVTLPQCVCAGRLSDFFPDAYDGISEVIVADGVTEIGAGAFAGCTGLMNVKMPNSVNRIGAGAFDGCDSIARVTLPQIVCSGRMSDIFPWESLESIWEVVIADGVTEIVDSAFSGCSGITVVVMPNSVTSIGQYVFSDCRGLTRVTIPQAVCSARLGNFFTAADSYEAIREVVVADGVTDIGEYAFEGCSGLLKVTIPNSVTNIAYNAFSGCAGLASMTVPQIVCSQRMENFIPWELLGQIKEIVIANGVTKVGEYAFYYCSGLTSVTIPDSVTSIEDYAFQECRGLDCVIMPNSVTSIGDYAFSGCDGIKEVMVPQCVCAGISQIFPDSYQTITNLVIADGTASICPWVFSEWQGLRSVTIPDSVIYIGDNAFENCSRLTSVKFPLRWNISELFPNSYQTLSTVVGLQGDGYVSQSMFAGCENLNSVVLPNVCTEIEASAFRGLVRLESVTMPSGIVSIGDGAFAGCSGIRNVTVPQCVCARRLSDTFPDSWQAITDIAVADGVRSVGQSAFAGCSALAHVAMPNSVTEVDSSAFVGCSSIKSVTVPQDVCNRSLSEVFPDSWQIITNVVVADGVATIGQDAFSGCSSIATVTMPNSLTEIEHYAFSGCSDIVSVTVPQAVCSRRLNEVFSWEALDSIRHIAIADGVKSINEDFFSDCPGLTCVTIPNSVTRIGEDAFRFCDSLTSVAIPQAISSRRMRDFFSWQALESITDVVIADGVACIGNRMFEGCNGLSHVTIPDSVMSIGAEAFSGCEDLTITMPQSLCSRRLCDLCNYESLQSIRHIVIAEGVTSIGREAFAMCQGLVSVTIPNSVTAIGANAFAGCGRLVSVVIPDSVTSIEDGAFNSCNGLISISVADGNPVYASVNGLLLTKDGKTLVQGVNGDVVIPSCVAVVGRGAFSGCSGLTSVTIPDSVTSVEDSAFSGCSGLTSITIPDRVTSVGNRAFYGCSGLVDVVLGEGVTNIAYWAFNYCRNLKNVVFKGNAPEVGNAAFSSVDPSCTAWVKRGSTGWGVEIPGTWNGIKIAYSDRRITFDANGGEGEIAPLDVAMNATTNLTANAFVHGGFEFVGWATSPDGEVVYADGAEITPEDDMSLYAVWQAVGPRWIIENGILTGVDLNGFTDVIIPNDVTGIGDGAFEGCTYMTSVAIPNSVTNIGDSAFRGCGCLASVTIPDSVTNIGSNAFYFCSSLANVLIPEGVTSIGASAFGGCRTLTEVVIPNSVTNVGDYAFWGCRGLMNVSIPATVISMGNETFRWCESLEYLTIQDGVTSIGDSMFADCTNLTVVRIPNSVTNIGRWAFDRCKGIRDVTVSQYVCDRQVCSVFPSAFESITNVVILNSVTNIGGYGAFIGCESLTQVKIPDSVTSIGERAFCRCVGLTSMTIPNGVTNIGDQAFSGCSGLTSVTIPGSVVDMGVCAFQGCKNLAHVAMLDGVESIGDSAFVGCTSLTNITIPNSVTNIESYAFANCTNLVTVTLPDSVTHIGESAFQFCSSLTRLTIPQDVTSIGNTAFQNCSSLTSVTIAGFLDSYSQSHIYIGTPSKLTTYVTANWTGPTDTWQGRAVEYLTHSLSFDPNGGEGEMESQKVIWYGTTNIVLNAFVRNGFGFLGWATSPDGEVAYADGAEITPEDDMALYAVWKTTSPTWTIEDGVLTYVELNGDTDIAIPEGVVAVGEYAFGGSEITSVRLPASLQVLEPYAFSCCYALTNITFSIGLKSIGECAFEGCYSLSGVFELPEGLTSIGRAFVFSGSQITDLVLPSTLTSLDEQEFLWCDSLENIWFKGNAPEVPDGSSRTDAAKYETSPYYDAPENLVSRVRFGSTGWFGSTTALPAKWPVKEWPDYAARDIKRYGGNPPRGTSGVVPDDASLVFPIWFVDESGVSWCIDEMGTLAGVELNGHVTVSIPSGTTAIEAEVFKDCGELKEVIIPDGVKSIGEYAFAGCVGLTNVTIPDSVESVGEHAFDGCSSLKEAFAPESLKWGGIPESTFSDCASGFLLSYYEWSYHYINDGTEVEIGDEWGFNESAIAPVPTGVVIIPSVLNGYPVTSIGEEAFADDSVGIPGQEKTCVMTRVIIPDSVRNIGNSAFHNCTGLVEVVIGAAVTNIGNGAFRFCENLTDITIPESVEHLDDWAFSHCFALTNVMMSAGVTNIGIAPFGGCRNLMSIAVADDNPAYASVDGLLLTKDGKALVQGINRDVAIPDSVENIEGCAFFLCDALTSMTIPAGVKNIGYGAFVGCFGLNRFDVNAGNRSYKSVSGLLLTKDGKTLVAVPGGVEIVAIPTGVKNIGECAVYGCTNLVSVTIPNGVTSIGDWAFAECNSLKHIMIPDSVTSIGEDAFYFCKSLTSVKVPASVTSIGNRAFAGCYALKTLSLPMSLEGKVDENELLGYSGYGLRATVSYYSPGAAPVMVAFDPNGGDLDDEADAVREVKKGAAIGVLPVPTRDDYVFLGWFTAAQGGTMVAVATKVSKDVVYYAHWQYLGYADDSTIVYELEESYETEEDGYFALDLSETIGSTSELKITVKGLPSGIKYDSKAMAIVGKSTKPGVYTVTVSATNNTVKKPVTATFKLVVPNLTCDALPDLKPEADAYGTVQCGVAFDSGLVDCTPDNGWTVKAAGLPAGLKLVQDKATGTYSITGVPTKAGTYTVTFTASKKGEKSQVATITLKTEALPDWAVGTFTGYVQDYGVDTEFGSATMTVAANGKVSGKLTLCGTNWTFKADSFSSAAVDPSSEVGSPKSLVVNAEAKAGKATMPVEIGLWPSGAPASGGAALLNASCEGWCGDPSSTCINLWRNMWKDKSTSAAAKSVLTGWDGVYTLSAEDGGYLSLTVGKTGDVKVSGKLGDGTSVSATAPLMYHPCYDYFTFVSVSPSAYKGGFVYLPIGFGTERGPLNALGHALVMYDRNPQATGEYGNGSYRWLPFTGAYYDKSDKLNSHYESLRFATEAPELQYMFKETFIGESGRKTTESYIAYEPAVETLGQSGTTAGVGEKGFVVAKATKPTQDKTTKEWSYNGANDGALSLSFAQATGIFKGSYTFWYDYMSAYDSTKPEGKQETIVHTSKKVSFEGIWVQGMEELRGFYLWDATGFYSDPKTGKSKTYKYKEPHAVNLRQ